MQNQEESITLKQRSDTDHYAIFLVKRELLNWFLSFYRFGEDPKWWLQSISRHWDVLAPNSTRRRYSSINNTCFIPTPRHLLPCHNIISRFTSLIHLAGVFCTRCIHLCTRKTPAVQLTGDEDLHPHYSNPLEIIALRSWSANLLD